MYCKAWIDAVRSAETVSELRGAVQALEEVVHSTQEIEDIDDAREVCALKSSSLSSSPSPSYYHHVGFDDYYFLSTYKYRLKRPWIPIVPTCESKAGSSTSKMTPTAMIPTDLWAKGVEDSSNKQVHPISCRSYRYMHTCTFSLT